MPFNVVLLFLSSNLEYILFDLFLVFLHFFDIVMTSLSNGHLELCPCIEI